MINQTSGPITVSCESVQNQLTHRWALKNVVAQLHNNHYLSRREKMICFDWLESGVVCGSEENLTLLSHLLSAADKTHDQNILFLFFEFAVLFAEREITLTKDIRPQLFDTIFPFRFIKDFITSLKV